MFRCGARKLSCVPCLSVGGVVWRVCLLFADAEAMATAASEHAYEFLPYSTAYQQAEKLGMSGGADLEASLKA